MVSMDVEEYRPGFGRGLAIAILVIAALGMIVSLVSAPLASLRYLPAVALVVVCVWAAFWWPAVIVSPAGVTLKNIVRTIELPWPAIQRIDTQFALTLFTAYGQYSAWAAPAPGRAGVAQAGHRAVTREESRLLTESTVNAGQIRPGDLPSSASGAAALLVRRRWEELRDAGLLDDAQLERNRPVVRWHWRTLLAIGGLALATVLALTLT